MKRRIWVYILLFFLVSINYMDRTNLSVASSPIAKDLHLQPATLGILFSSFLWIYLIVLIPAGMATDRWGARLVNAISVVIWSIASICTGLSSSLSALLFSRLGMGLGESPTYPASARTVGQWAPASERGRGVASYNAGSYAGPAIGSLFVGWLVTQFGWRSSFYVTGAIGFVWLIAWLIWYRKPEDAKWLKQEEREKILAERAMPVKEEGSKHGVLYLLKYKGMWGVMLTQSCAVYAQYLFLTWLPNYLETARGLTVLKSGFISALPYFIAVVLGIIFGMLSDRLLTKDARNTGARRIGVVAAMVISAVVLLTPFVQSITMIIVLISISLSFISTSITLNITLTNDLLRVPSSAGQANSLLMLGGNVFGLLAPIVTGFVVQYTGSFTGAFVIAGVLLIAGAIISFTLTRSGIGEQDATSGIGEREVALLEQ
jgi:MFS family permease